MTQMRVVVALFALLAIVGTAVDPSTKVSNVSVTKTAPTKFTKSAKEQPPESSQAAHASAKLVDDFGTAAKAAEAKASTTTIQKHHLAQALPARTHPHAAPDKSTPTAKVEVAKAPKAPPAQAAKKTAGRNASASVHQEHPAHAFIKPAAVKVQPSQPPPASIARTTAHSSVPARTEPKGAEKPKVQAQQSPQASIKHTAEHPAVPSHTDPKANVQAEHPPQTSAKPAAATVVPSARTALAAPKTSQPKISTAKAIPVAAPLTNVTRVSMNKDTSEMHFLRRKAGECQCQFTGQCTCQLAMEFMNCISKACSSGKCVCPVDQYKQSCLNVVNACDNLEFHCGSNKTRCSAETTRIKVEEKWEKDLQQEELGSKKETAEDILKELKELKERKCELEKAQRDGWLNAHNRLAELAPRIEARLKDLAALKQPLPQMHCEKHFEEWQPMPPDAEKEGPKSAAQGAAPAMLAMVLLGALLRF